jgi:hypothetical protein
LGQLAAADVAPASQMVAAVAERRAASARVLEKWAALQGAPLAALNVRLKQSGQPEVKVGMVPQR